MHHALESMGEECNLNDSTTCRPLVCCFGVRGSVMAKVLCYKLEGREFNT
jgi:hypothetical protein